jgi:enolase
MKTCIKAVRARSVWDSRGRPTVEAEIRLANGAVGRAIAPSGASTGSGEALDKRDGGTRFGGFGVSNAVAMINERVAPALAGLDAAHQGAIDRALEDLDATATFTDLGGNAAIAVSLAAAHAAAAATAQPLWMYLADGAKVCLPVPEIQIYGGGAHAAGALDLQDLMIVPYGARSFREALEWAGEVYRAAGVRRAASARLHGVADEGGYWPDFATNEAALQAVLDAIEAAGFCPQTEIAISVDAAASQMFEDDAYHLRTEGRRLTPQAWAQQISAWLNSYPIRILEDPFVEHDLESHARLTAEFGARAQIVGDDLLVSDAARVRAAAQAGACNTLLCKPNQAGTLTRARAAFDAAIAAGWNTIVSARSGESEDVTIAHLAVGWNARQIKVGSFSRSERMAKWNELLRIEEALCHGAAYAGASIFALRTNAP